MRGLQTSLVWLFSHNTATSKTKLAILAFFYCGEFLKTSNVNKSFHLWDSILVFLTSEFGIIGIFV